jgi:hypothetical protein
VLNSIIQGGVPPVHVRLLADVLGFADLARSCTGRRRLWPSALHGPRFMGRDEFLVAVRSYLPNAQDCQWHRVEMGKALMAAGLPRRSLLEGSPSLAKTPVAAALPAMPASQAG